jgi:hypothetical protein
MDRDRYRDAPRRWENHGEERRFRRGQGWEQASYRSGRDWPRYYDDETRWERETYAPDTRPGYIEPVPGQTSEGSFWTESLEGPSRDRLTGAELRRYQHDFDPDYVSWRDDQLRAHDRDYHAWREERRRSYDEDYGTWRRERQEKFGQDFSDWRSRRTAEPAARPGETDEPETHDS